MGFHTSVLRRDGCTTPPAELPADFLCVCNFGPDSRTVKLFLDLGGRRGVTLPTMAVSLTPDQAVVVRQIVLRALRDVSAVVSGERFVV